MMQSILQNQKNQLEQLQNQPFVPRELFSRAQSQLSHTLIKLITGPRRVGKSTFALELVKNHHFGFVNFDDPDIQGQLVTYANLTEALNELYDNPPFLLLDEIQNVPHWETYLNSLQRAGKNLIVTGSNAHMLSRDIATVLTGRALEMQLFPFSYPETQISGKQYELDTYLLSGSYPEVILKSIDPDLYYQSLFNTSIVKDILVRFSLRNPLEFENLVKYFLANIGTLYSYTSVAQKTGISVPTVSNYVDYLQETYLFFELPFFSYKQSEISKNHKKMYVVDYAFSRFITAPVRQNKGMALENAVFVQLLRQGYQPGRTLFYFQSAQKEEVDFLLVKPDGGLHAVQVCYTLEDETTAQRELRGLDACAKQLGTSMQMTVVSAQPTHSPLDHAAHFVSFEEFARDYNS